MFHEPQLVPSTKTKSRVLVVDDEPRLLTSLQSLLQLHGYVVDIAEGGKAACRKVTEKNYELILLDLRMPECDGHQVMNFLAENGIDSAVIVISGETSFTAVSQALRRGAYDYLKKPFSNEELISTAKRVLEKKQLERDHAHMHRRLKESSILHQYIVDSSPDIVFMLDKQGCFTFLNDKVVNLLGYSKEELKGKHFSSVLSSKDLLSLTEAIEDLERGTTVRNVEVKIKQRVESHTKRFFELTIFPIFASALSPTKSSSVSHAYPTRGLSAASQNAKPDDIIGIYGTARDITERKEAQDFINFQAYHDLLTGLPNRALFKDRLNMAIARCRRHHNRLAVLFLDLDRFKVVNDTLGHAMGDRLLQSVAERLQKCLREGDTLSRFGGDEFVLLLPEVTTPDDVRGVARKILRLIKAPFHLDQHEVFVGVSIGIAVFPDAGSSIDQLIQAADVAMYHVKKRAKEGYQFFSDTMVVNASNRLEIERDLRKALANNELHVYYQPKVDALNGEIIGVEALVRWQHPEHGMIYPSQFIPLAEETRLIVNISEWVLGKACEEVKKWIEAGYRHVQLAVNFVQAQIEHPQFVDLIRSTLAHYQFPPENLEVELTENMIMQDLEPLVAKLQALAKEGVTIAIDDFGTGYSSLSWLKKLPIHTLKVDKSFIQDIRDNDEACIVNAIVSMAHGLKLNIVAEGVETEHQLDYLRKLGCQEVQGFYFSEARPAEEAMEMLSAYKQNSVGLDRTH